MDEEREEGPRGVQAGDRALYLPAECHALHKDAAGDYPWAVGVKRVVAEGGEVREAVKEFVASRELSEHLDRVRRYPSPAEEAKKLVLLRPVKPWEAVVTAVNSDGTVDLDVSSANAGGVTLHYTHVPVDRSRRRAHTCYLAPKGG